MASGWDSMDVHLLKVLYLLLTDGSVSRVARRLNQSQPAVSAALRRLREITGDKLLVRSRDGMTPTDRGAALLEPVRIALEQIDTIAGGGARFKPGVAQRVFSLATPDYLNPLLLGQVLERVQRAAPQVQLTVHSMTQNSDYAHALESGDLDLVIANWPNPPETLRAAPLFEDRMVVMMRADHRLASRELTTEDYLEAAHLAPTPYSVGQRGVIDTFLARERIRRRVVAQVPYFNMAPYMLLETEMIFTAPARFAAHYVGFLPLVVQRSPLPFPTIKYYLLWHDRSQHAEDCRWLREQIMHVARADGAAAPFWQEQAAAGRLRQTMLV
jgi:DNA-binding transcriptional LysR family regulator